MIVGKGDNATSIRGDKYPPFNSGESLLCPSKRKFGRRSPRKLFFLQTLGNSFGRRERRIWEKNSAMPSPREPISFQRRFITPEFTGRKRKSEADPSSTSLKDFIRTIFKTHKCTEEDCRFLFDRAVGFVNNGKSPGD